MKRIRTFTGWLIVVAAGLCALSAGLCAVLTLTGQLQGISGFGPRLGYTAAFLLITAVCLWAVRPGRKLRVVPRQTAAPAGKPAAPVPVPEEPPVKASAAATAKPPAPPVEPERKPLPTWETSPGMHLDREPFRKCREIEDCLDSLRDGAVCRVYSGELPLEAAIRLMLQTDTRLGPCNHVRIEDSAVLEDCEEGLFALCRSGHIRLVTYEGDYGLYDHVNRCHLKIYVETWPGSADDAATYGRWWAEELPA